MKLTYNDTKISGIKRIVFNNGRIKVVMYEGNDFDLIIPDNAKIKVEGEDG
jgi:hypothetical protein